MRNVEVLNATRGTTLGARVEVADRWWRRLRGLLGRPGLAEGAGLLLTPCRSVHMLGMRFPLDVLFLDAAGTVVATYPRLAPGRRTGWHRAALSALELPAGAIERSATRPGDVLVVRSAEPGPKGRRAR